MKKVTAVLATFCFTLLLFVLLVNAARAEGDGIDKPKALVLASLADTGRAGLSAAGWGMNIRQLDRLPDGRRVRLTGTVEYVQDSRQFLLRDATGSVDVTLDSDVSADLKKGLEVTVAGRINRGILGPNIDAHSITLKNPVNEARLEMPSSPARKPTKISTVQNASVASVE